MTNKPTELRSFTLADADPQALKDENIAVVGYGNLGRVFAQNLRDSGVTSLLIGNNDDEYLDKAKEDGFLVKPISDAILNAGIVLVLLPDEIIPEIYTDVIEDNLSPGSAIVFASGYNLAYDLIKPSNDIDILLLAPRMAGENARMRYKTQQGFYAYISVEQEVSGKAWRRLLGLARDVGVLQAGAIELDAKREADLDLLVEQTLGAAIGVSIMNVFALGQEAGIPPEAMVMEMYMSEEMEFVWRAFREKGFFFSSSTHGPTALYGGFVRTMNLMSSDLIANFRKTLDEIINGDFARSFQEEREAGYPMLTQAEDMSLGDSPITQAEESLRSILNLST